MINRLPLFIPLLLLTFPLFDVKTKLPETEINKRWIMVWSDEFNMDGMPDPSRWSYDTGDGGWGNNEPTYYTRSRKENVNVKDGVLIIQARKEKFSSKSQYTSARIHSKYKGDWKYGRIEVKAKVPTGNGLLPAIWMLPRDSVYGKWPASGEIDIMEHFGFMPDRVHASLHTSLYNHKTGTELTNSVRTPALTEKFHIYTLLWDEKKIIFYRDNEEIYSVDKISDDPAEWPFDHEFYLLMTLRVGGDWAEKEGIDNSLFPAQMEVDWVRVYQQREYSPPFTLTAEKSPYGEIHITPDKNFYMENKNVIVQARAVEGYVFDRWEGDAQGRDEILYLTMKRNIHLIPIYKKTGEMIQNGDMAMGKKKWYLQNFNGAQGEYSADHQGLKILIHKEGKEKWQIQLNQYGIHLKQYKNYRLKITLRSEGEKMINAGFARSTHPYTPYFVDRFLIDENLKTYTMDFTMSESDDYNTRFFLDSGINDKDIIIKSISCIELP